MRCSKLGVFVVFLFASLSSSCSTTKVNEARWESAETSSVSQHVLNEVVKLALAKSDFPVLGSGFDPVTRTMTSGWRTDLVPMTGRRTRGFRERAWVQYSAAEMGKFKIEVRVEREVNKNLARPLDPEYADWESGPDAVERAKFLLQLIKVSLRSGSK